MSPEQADELRQKYRSVEAEDAKAGWEEVYEASLNACMHGPYCNQGSDCQVLHPLLPCLPRKPGRPEPHTACPRGAFIASSAG